METGCWFFTARSTSPCAVVFNFELARGTYSRGKGFLSLTASLPEVEWHELQKKPLAVVGLTTFEDLGVSWVDVVIRGLSMSFDCGFAVARATNRNTSSIIFCFIGI